MKHRIKLEMTINEVIMALGGGNPGGLTVCLSLMNDAERCDPENFAGPLGPLMLLDTFHIYEERIWMLFKDLCGSSGPKTIAILRACQMGVVSPEDLNKWIDDGLAHQDDADKAIEKVKAVLPSLVVD